MKTVRNSDGKFYSPASPVADDAGWAGPAHANCYEDAEAERVAIAVGGIVAPVPVYNPKTRAYE